MRQNPLRHLMINFSTNFLNSYRTANHGWISKFKVSIEVYRYSDSSIVFFKPKIKLKKTPCDNLRNYLILFLYEERENCLHLSLWSSCSNNGLNPLSLKESLIHF